MALEREFLTVEEAGRVLGDLGFHGVAAHPQR